MSARGERPSAGVGPRVRPLPVSRRRPGARIGGAALALGAVATGIAALVLVRGGDPQALAPVAAVAAPSLAGTQVLPEGAPPQLPDAAQEAPQPALSDAAQGALPPEPPVPTSPVAVAAAAPPPPAAAPPAAAPPTPAPDRASLTVLNNSRVPDLGARAAERYRAGGWPVSAVGNLRGRVAASTVFYGPGQQEQARVLAEQFGVPRVLPRGAGLPGRGLTVVLTRDQA